MLIFFSAFNPRFPMNKARINSFCHGESARVPAGGFVLWTAAAREHAFGGAGGLGQVTFLLLGDLLGAVLPLQRGVRFGFHTAGRGQG